MPIQKFKTLLLGLVVVIVASLALMPSLAMSQTVEVILVGGQETPPVATSASGKATIVVSADMSVSGTITTSGMDVKAAHIHTGALGVAGPVIIPFVKTSENVWSLMQGAKFTGEQYKSFKAGNLYINVHSPTYPGGEIRGQIKLM